MKTYRAGIVGLSGIAARPVDRDLSGALVRPMPGSHAASFEAHPRTEVVAVCDLQAPLINEFRENFAQVWPNVAGYTDCTEMLAEAELDLLSVVTSDHRHTQIVLDAVTAGVQGIFCEKPLATTVADADAMIDAVEAAGIPMLVDHTRRWWTLWRHAWDRVQAGDIGKVQRIFATLGGPRAMLFRNGTHLVDSVVWFADGEPEWVSGELDPGFEDYFEYRGDGGRDPATDPGGSGYVHFDNGVRAFINASKGTPAGFYLIVIGDQGVLNLSNRGAQVETDGAVRSLQPPKWQYTQILGGVDELVRLLDAGGPPDYPHGCSTGPEARKTVKIICGLLESQRQRNNRVDL